MAVDAARAKSLFLAASNLSDGTERAAYLDRECAGDADLRVRVEALLRANDASPLEPGRAEDETSDRAPEQPQTADFPGKGEHVGAVLAGKYRLSEPIGEGGMGSVWVAHQSEPVKRKVAVKLIKAGMDSKNVLARFEAERQALAVMDHPNIAKVLDGGLYDGRPFFIMELVKGVPITEYCDARKLTPKERLELFIPVCQAIQHAHQKGIIHRDVKPSNVLIALYDDKPVPKVIDFGIAKATGGTLSEKTIETAFGGVVGTPQYMSPEQASLNNLDIDTRSDVYSLGVLLYELLTGSPPFARKELEKRGLLEILRVVREEEPPRPSVKLSTADALPSLSASRGTEPKKLTGLLRSELDWIVMKALEKDRARRYETANGFAADVTRYLTGEAVQAHPPSAAYRVKKFVRKHKARVVGTAAFLTLLLAAVVVSSWLAVQANRSEVAADRNAQAFLGAMIKADAALQEVERATVDQRVDADLVEYKADPRVGLLRLARTFRDLPPPPLHRRYPLEGGGEVVLQAADEHLAALRGLREFAAAAVLAAGQEYAPLLPPVTHDGHDITRHELSPDRRTILTFGADGTARLWNLRTATQVALLRREGERVVYGGFSLDGQTIFTDDASGVARFWEPDGRYRAQTPPRPNYHLERVDRLPRGEEGSTFVSKEIPQTPKQIGRDRLLTTRTPVKQISHPAEAGQFVSAEPDLVELWDTGSGRLVARLDRDGLKANEFRFLGAGEWISTTEKGTTVVVFSAKDGRLAGRLPHPDDKSITSTAASPSGRKLATIVCPSPDKYLLRIWDAETWKAHPPVAVNRFVAHFLTDELLAIRNGGWGGDQFAQVRRITPPESSIDLWSEICLPLLPAADLVLTDDEIVLDAKTGRRVVPPPGRRVHPSLSKFAADGRFVVAGRSVADTLTGKSLPASMWECGHQPGFGYLKAARSSFVAGYGVEVRLLPTTVLKDVPPDGLELWAQLVVRGELDAEGRYKKWDAATWEKQRQELAAVKPPHPDVPFPGAVVADKLYWLRDEFREASADPEQLRLAATLLARAEEMRDTAEAVRWREEVRKRTHETLPPPRKE